MTQTPIGTTLGESASRTIEQMNRYGRERRPFFFALDYELDEGIFLLDPLSTSSDLGGIRFEIGAYSTETSPSATDSSPALPPPRLLDISPESKDRYEKRFALIYQGLQRGDSFLTNLTIRTPISLEGSLPAIYDHSRAPYKLLIPDRFVCFSPERFVYISQGRISTNPMKGTIDALLPDAQERLTTDYKEGAEHYTIVDLMRNDLNRIARHVSVERFKYLSRIETSQGAILQMSSEIVGDLGETWHECIGDLILQLLPAGSISGAPKRRTCELIGEAEGIPRGFYTGVCGYYDGQTLDSGVLIRYIEQDEQGNYFYRSGGGITINSQMAEEWRECIQKVYLPCRQD